MTSLKSILKKVTPEGVRVATKRWLAPYRLRQSWLRRKSDANDDHLATYWNAEHQPNRQQLIWILSDAIGRVQAQTGDTEISVLEYGSHVGLNIRLLKENRKDFSAIKFYAVEPNAEAVAFLKEKMPDVSVLQGEDSEFLSRDSFPPPGTYVCFVNSVFYCKAPRRVEQALKKLCEISTVLVIGESLENIDGDKARLRNDPECFEHPYRSLLEKFGFEIRKKMTAVDPKPQLNGYIVACRKMQGLA